ncbi:MAG TPA: hypothetical protein VLT58_09050 [Polyangia bacterium]|nr:hypothetical protein [Polyangia bacterium]
METPEQTITITETPAVGAVAPSMPRLAVRFAIGLLQLTGEHVVSTLRQVQAADGRVDAGAASRPRRLRLRVAALWRVRVPPLGGALRRADVWRVRAAGSLARLRVAASQEQVEGRALALHTLRRLVRTAAAELADSPELKRVIREQSQGLAAGAISEMRQRSARADDAAQELARRALHLPGERR